MGANAAPAHIAVTVTLPPVVWWALSAEAEQSGITVADLLERVAAAATAPRREGKIVDPEDAVYALWAKGHADRVIAAKLDMTNSKVQAIRRNLSIPANRSRR